MSNYLTLCFRLDDKAAFEDIRQIAVKDNCVAWSLDHSELRLDLVRKAIEEGDLKKAKYYINHNDVSKITGDLM